LRAKNRVDAAALSAGVAAALARAAPRRAPLRVVDLGAGLLSMLPRVLALARECEASGVDYFALEPEPGLWDENVQSLQGMGFSLEDGGEGRFWHEELQARVVLVREDFRALSPGIFGRVNLFVACCFCDLLSPEAVVKVPCPRAARHQAAHKAALAC
jgi:hypothetical protein